MPQQEETTYTQAITELEEIISKMQRNDCSIDNLNALTARSAELLKICRAKLNATDTQLQEILKGIEEAN